ncbi:MAG: hypothetical protein GWO08_11425, partial [Gammaproteobacteria bacterium]|nr:hypothetical protein [Gammaproteobacteria bacterium]NIR94243.1 hypothetical protein [Gammaproteobacteria bacterium]
MIRRIRTYFILIISVFVLTACIHPISKETRADVTPGLTSAMLNENPSAYINQSILIGGLVLSHTAEPEGSVLELLEWNINRWGEPTYLNDSGRRFLVKS